MMTEMISTFSSQDCGRVEKCLKAITESSHGIAKKYSFK